MDAKLVGRINKLPKWARRYIHDMATQADPRGDVADLIFLQNERLALIKTIGELKSENVRLKRRLRRLEP